MFNRATLTSVAMTALALTLAAAPVKAEDIIIRNANSATTAAAQPIAAQAEVVSETITETVAQTTDGAVAVTETVSEQIIEETPVAVKAISQSVTTEIEETSAPAVAAAEKASTIIPASKIEAQATLAPVTETIAASKEAFKSAVISDSHVSELFGKVDLIKANTSNPTLVELNGALTEGDSIVTGPQSHATVTFKNAGDIIISQNSAVSIASIANTNVLVKSPLWAAYGYINKIETSLASFALKGGRLIVGEKDKGVDVYLYEGVAVVNTAQGTVVLTAGQGVTIDEQGFVSAAATWTEDQVKWMRVGLPKDTLPSLTVVPQKVKKPAVKKAKPVEKKAEVAPTEATPVEATAPVVEDVVTTETVETPALDASTTTLAPVEETVIEEILETPAPAAEIPALDAPVSEAPVIEAPALDAPFDAEQLPVLDESAIPAN
jgi:hypothetical protein